MTPHDVIIVGGSFAGQSAAMQLARARRRVLVVDAGLPRNRFADAAHGFLGQDGRPPAEIMREARRQLEAYPTVDWLTAEAVEVSGEIGAFTLRTADGRDHHARRLVLALGVRDTLPDIPGLHERWGASVLHCPYCHGFELRDRPLGVLASHPMSAHQAAMLPDWGPTTYFSQGQFEPDADQAALLSTRGATIERSPIVELLGSAPELEAVRLADGRVLPLAGLFIAPKTQLASSLASDLGCAFLDGMTGPYLQVDEMKATSVPGVFAAGDATRQMHNATFASADGVMAGVAAHRSLMMDAEQAA
jgi:thioredoxin reductase